MAGGEESGCGSGDKVGHTSYILYSLQPALELEGWFLLAPGMQRFSNPVSDSGCAHSLAENKAHRRAQKPDTIDRGVEVVQMNMVEFRLCKDCPYPGNQWEWHPLASAVPRIQYVLSE